MEASLTQDEIMRKAILRWKGNIIARTKDKIVVDLGSGRFGDLFNYAHAGTLQVIGIEPNANNLKEGARRIASQRIRWLQSSSTMHLANVCFRTVHAGAEESIRILQQLPDVHHGVDMAVSFLSLTFAFESQEKLDGWFTTLIGLLKDRASFVGIYMDGGRTKTLLLDKNAPATRRDNNTYTLSDLSSVGISGPFGQQVGVHFKRAEAIVKMQIEYLVDFDEFCRQAKKHGFVLTTDCFLEPPDSLTDNDLRDYMRCQRAFAFQYHAAGTRNVSAELGGM